VPKDPHKGVRATRESRAGMTKIVKRTHHTKVSRHKHSAGVHWCCVVARYAKRKGMHEGEVS